ncbi:hypothetical protein A2U01_0102535, partial [Trifolium medium]|nr:hypothetical protein [Trifolium medium]
VLLTKYIGFSSPSTSWTKAELSALSDTARYKHNVFPCSGRVRIGGDAKNAFNF